MRCAQRADILAMPAASCLPACLLSALAAAPCPSAPLGSGNGRGRDRLVGRLDQRGTHSDLSLAVEYFGIEAIGGREGGMSSITVRVRRTACKLVVVVRSCITKGDHHAPLQRRLFSPPPSIAAGDKKRRESLRSIYVAVRSFVRSLRVAAACHRRTNKRSSIALHVLRIVTHKQAEEKSRVALEMHATFHDEIGSAL